MKEDLFAPFDADGILCVQDGKITTDPTEDEDWMEWHIEKYGSDLYRIDRCDSEVECSFVYQGKIPTREFFVDLMNNQEVPLPVGWENGNA